MWLESKPGAGSTFYMALPLKTRPEQANTYEDEKARVRSTPI
jgi:hypothetical protein